MHIIILALLPLLTVISYINKIQKHHLEKHFSYCLISETSRKYLFLYF